tara:strand:+ start:3519 stop:3923 length:405 start_codon:yes stop_codon:yes gene_type:complete
MNSKFNKILKAQIIIFIVLFVLTLMTFICLGILTYKLSSYEDKSTPQKIINDINVYNNDTKYMSEREFKQRFPKAYKTWHVDIKTLDDDYDKIDGAIYALKNGNLVIYFHNGYEPTFALRYDEVANNWYEEVPN